MSHLIRPRPLVAAVVLAVALVGASQNAARADDTVAAQPAPFLTSVTEDVDAYWTEVFDGAGLDEPRVGYAWLPSGTQAQSACGPIGESSAAYCPADDTIYIAEDFASGISTGALDDALPGSAQGYGRAFGDFAVAYIVAHEYGHQIQDELGLFERYGQQVPTKAFELQADCYAGTWARSAAVDNRLEDGDVEEALDAALAVGDFDASDPGHHGTPEERREAWSAGFDSGDPAACAVYLDAA